VPWEAEWSRLADIVPPHVLNRDKLGGWRDR
jgi:hypothetical protein